MDEIKSPIKAIRAFCLECVGYNANDVKNCTSKDCPLKPVRVGRNPFLKKEMTEEQKEAARERLAKARKAKE